MNPTELDQWSHDELTWLERHIIAIQDAVGAHFPWCDVFFADAHLPCSCGMDAMRENRAMVLNIRAYGTPNEPAGHP